MSDKPKRESESPNSITWEHIIVFVPLFVIGSCLLLVVGVFFFAFKDTNLEGEKAIASIEDLLHVEMPASSNDVFFVDESFGSNRSLPATRFRFTALASEIETWLQSDTLCFELPLQIDEPFQKVFPTDPDWWQPHLLDSVAQGGCYNPNNYYSAHGIQIDQSNLDFWTVYFELWFY